MEESTIELIAAQLRKPEGEYGANVGELMNFGNLAINEHTMAALKLQDNNSVLELGMGNGHFVPRILDFAKNIEYRGCDYSEIMVKEAIKRNKASVKKGQAAFVHADGQDMPYEDAQFDVIFTVNTIYFWDDNDAVMQELNRVLKINGRLIIAFRPEEVMKLYPMTRYNFQFWDIEPVTELMEQHGFERSSAKHHVEPPSQDVDGNDIRAENVIFTATKLSQ